MRKFNCGEAQSPKGCWQCGNDASNNAGWNFAHVAPPAIHPHLLRVFLLMTRNAEWRNVNATATGWLGFCPKMSCHWDNNNQPPVQRWHWGQTSNQWQSCHSSNSGGGVAQQRKRWPHPLLQTAEKAKSKLDVRWWQQHQLVWQYWQQHSDDTSKKKITSLSNNQPAANEAATAAASAITRQAVQ